MTSALEGVKVLDFCWVAIGPMTTRYLSDFGATVVRVESIHRVDTLRTATPHKDGVPGINRSGYFANYNGGKRSIALNMSQPRARELAKELARWADVVTENFTPGIMERWGLGYDALREINPGVIMFSASMQGRGGPYSNHPGFGPVLTALSSHTHLTGWPDRTPTSPYGAYTDFLLPHLTVAAITAALDKRRRTGEGCHLDFSQLEGSLYFVAPPLMDYAANGRVQTRRGNEHPTSVPHNAYRCAGDDRWCAIACTNDDEWRSLCSLMGQPSLASDGRFATAEARKRNEEVLDGDYRTVDGRTGRLRVDGTGVRRRECPRGWCRPARTCSTIRSYPTEATMSSWTTRRLAATPAMPTASPFRKVRQPTSLRPCWESIRTGCAEKSSAFPRTKSKICANRES